MHTGKNIQQLLHDLDPPLCNGTNNNNNSEHRLSVERRRKWKNRLSKMKERSNVLLRNRDWERYFPTTNQVDPFNLDQSWSRLSSNNQAGTNNQYHHHLNCSLSAINHLDYDSLLMQTNINNNNNNNNNKKLELNLMPFFLNASASKKAATTIAAAINKDESIRNQQQQQIQKTPHPTTRRKSSKKSLKRVVVDKSLEEESSDEGKCQQQLINYQLNTLPRIRASSLKLGQKLILPPPSQQYQHNSHQRHNRHHHHHHHHHQSMTFIADLAQTSTPTRTTRAPITSTPKQRTHDPLKYHPTQTIRSKKTTTMTTSTVNKCSVCCMHKQKRIVVETAAAAVANPRRNSKRKRGATTSNNSIVVCNSWTGGSGCDLCNHHDVSTTRAAPVVAIAANSIDDSIIRTNNVKKSRVKFVKTSNFELSIHDLLYVPSKSTANKFDLVTTTRPRVKKQQVYFL